jgi:hypothetical protein
MYTSKESPFLSGQENRWSPGIATNPTIAVSKTVCGFSPLPICTRELLSVARGHPCDEIVDEGSFDALQFRQELHIVRHF